MSRLRVAMLLGLVLGSHTRALAQSTREKELLDFVVEAHRAARERIQTLQCRVQLVVMVAPKQETQTVSAHYWYSRDAIRAKIEEPTHNLDYLLRDNVSNAITTR